MMSTVARRPAVVGIAAMSEFPAPVAGRSRAGRPGQYLRVLDWAEAVARKAGSGYGGTGWHGRAGDRGV